jgi:phospholipid transport system substrate-binding protein
MTTTRRIFLTFSSAAVLGAAFGPHSAARAEAATDSASAFVKSTGEQLVAVVNGAGSIQDKRPKLARIVEAAVDVDGVAKFCLGRFWRTATPEQQKQYMALFHDVLVNSVTGNLGDYQGVRLTVGRTQQREDTQVVTTTVERPNNPPSQVDWVVSQDSGKPKIVDVVAEGTSLRLTQRSDYAAYLSRNGNNVQALIDAMRQQVAQNG